MNLALAFATIERPPLVQRLVRSVRRHFPDMPIYVADQSRQIGPMRDFYEAQRVQVVPMPFDAGVAASRNRLTATIVEEFFVLCDDDFIIDAETSFDNALAILAARPEIGIVGGRLRDTSNGDPYDRHWEMYLQYDPGNRKLTAVPIFHFAPQARLLGDIEYYACDTVMNFAVFRRSPFADGVGWDERFTCNGEHEDFYLRLKHNGGPAVAYLPSMVAVHDHPYGFAKYREKLRERPEGWRLFMRKWQIDQYLELGFGVRTIHRPGEVVGEDAARRLYAIAPNPARSPEEAGLAPPPRYAEGALRGLRVSFRYDPVVRPDCDFFLWHRTERIRPSPMDRATVWLRWFDAADRALVWESERSAIDLTADYWRPLLVAVPLFPPEAASLRFDVVVDALPVPLPIANGMVFKSPQASAGQEPPSADVLALTPEDEPAARLRSDRAGINAAARADALRLRPGITVVVTSCGRQDLLARTLTSFFAYNSGEVARIIVVEDGAADKNAALMQRFRAQAIDWIGTQQRVGQILAIDTAYALVDTEWIFHLEDDWEFYAPGFIEKSQAVLTADPSCLEVMLRALDDTNGHPLLPEAETIGGVETKTYAFGFDGVWHGFSFNPGLRRTADYRRLGSYGLHVRYAWRDRGVAEAGLSQIYRDLGMHVRILADREGAGYVRHIGWERTVAPPLDR